MHLRTIHAAGDVRRPVRRRRGVAAVEFAVVASLLFMLLLGIIEIGRAMMVLEMLNNAARSGARMGTLQGSANTDVTSAVTNALANAGFSGTSTAVSVNGATANVNTAVAGDSVTVTVSVPYNNVTWLPTSMFLAGRTLGSTVVMRHE
jgi:Flp pilus assembly protein TadG